MSSDQISPVLPKALRVCIVSENASFRFGGEATLPLQYFSRLRARGIETWLVVHDRTRQELEDLFPTEQDRIQYIPDKWYHKLIFQLSRHPSRRFSEAIFNTLLVLINRRVQRDIVLKLIREQRINIVHQPVPVSPKAPSFLSNLGLPVIIGPMNGGMEYPPAFRGAESFFTRISIALGRGSANLVNNIIAGKKHATLLLIANQRTRLALPACARGQIIEIPENGVDLSVWSPPTKSAQTTKTVRFVYIGRLVSWKRLDFVLRALAVIPGARLEAIGVGPKQAAWASLAEALGIADRVRWHGWLAQSECARILQDATALLLPSIYESGGAVVLEAMACGVPVVAVSWGGPAAYLDSSCGILVDPSSPKAITEGFVEAMRTLIADPVLCERLGSAGRKRVEELFDWNQKIDRIIDLYWRGIHAFQR